MRDGMKDVIKVQFVRDCKAGGREYTYYSPETVSVGDIADVETTHGVTQAQVSQINVPLEEITRFADRARAIIGKTACKCEDCELLVLCPDESGVCDADTRMIPTCGGLPTDQYLWCMGCFFMKKNDSGASQTATENGQIMMEVPGGSRLPWDRP